VDSHKRLKDLDHQLAHANSHFKANNFGSFMLSKDPASTIFS